MHRSTSSITIYSQLWDAQLRYTQTYTCTHKPHVHKCARARCGMLLLRTDDVDDDAQQTACSQFRHRSVIIHIATSTHARMHTQNVQVQSLSAVLVNVCSAQPESVPAKLFDYAIRSHRRTQTSQNPSRARLHVGIYEHKQTPAR